MGPILKPKKMINLRRLAVYLLAFILLMIISSIITAKGLLIPVDQFVFKSFSYNKDVEEKFKDKIIIVDLYNKSKTRENGFLNFREFRDEVGIFLSTIDSMVDSGIERKPTIILDITFRQAEDGLPAIKTAIDSLRTKYINVYAVYKMPASSDETSYEDWDNGQAKELYKTYFAGGRLHTNLIPSDDRCIITYNSSEKLGDRLIKALPVQVANDYMGLKTNLNDQEIINIPIEGVEQFAEQTFEFTDDSLAVANGNYPKFDKSQDLNDKIIVVGAFAVDQKKICKKSVPGPFLIARALTDRLQNNELSKVAYGNVGIALGITFLFTFFVCLFFAVIYKYLKKFQTKPLLIGVLAFFCGLILLLGLVFFSLNYMVIRPALPTLGMFWAAFLAWRFTKKFLVTGIMEGGERFDVFISYSFGDGNWVRNELFKPLNEFKKPDGSRLNIFFAEKSIGIGELFTTKYMRAIVDSKLFIPVISKEYYEKNHCRNEMDLAVKRYIEKLINICIVAFDYNFVPEEFTNILLLDINQQTDFMSKIKKNLVSQDQDLVDQQKGSTKIEVPEVQDSSEVVKPDVIEKSKVELEEQEDLDQFDDSDSMELDPEKSKQKEKEDKSKKKDKKKNKKKAEKEEKKKKGKKKSKKESKKKDKKENKKKDKKSSDKKDTKSMNKSKKNKEESKKKNKKKDKKKSKKESKKKDKKGSKKKKKKS